MRTDLQAVRADIATRAAEPVGARSGVREASSAYGARNNAVAEGHFPGTRMD